MAEAFLSYSTMAEAILSNTIQYKSKTCVVRCTHDGITISYEAITTEHTIKQCLGYIPIADIIGAEIASAAEATITLHTYPCNTAGCKPDSAATARKHKPVKLAFTPAIPPNRMYEWVTVIIRLACGMPLRDVMSETSPMPLNPAVPAFTSTLVDQLPRRRWLCIVSSASGKGQALTSYTKIWKPMMYQALVDPAELYTEHAGHAIDLVGRADLNAVDAIIAIGGDGIVHEVVQGLLTRADWDQHVHRLALGILPAGSGNALIASALYAADVPYGIVSSGIALVKGQPRLLDVASVQAQGHNLAHTNAVSAGAASSDGEGGRPMARFPRYAILSQSWAGISDIDIESERWRWAGAARFTMQGVVRALNVRTYTGRVAYLAAGPAVSLDELQRYEQARAGWGTLATPLPTPLVESVDSPAHGESGMLSHAASFAAATSPTEAMLTPPPAAGQTIAMTGPGAYTATTGPALRHVPDWRYDDGPAQAQHEPEALPPGWSSYEGELTLFTANLTTHQSYDVSMSPISGLADGLMYLLLAPGSGSVPAMVRLLLAMDGKASVAECAGIQLIPVRAYRLWPAGYRTGGMFGCGAQGEGMLCVDGELLPAYSPLSVEVHQGLLHVLAPETSYSGMRARYPASRERAAAFVPAASAAAAGPLTTAMFIRESSEGSSHASSAGLGVAVRVTSDSGSFGDEDEEA